jgi:hypothetical protein
MNKDVQSAWFARSRESLSDAPPAPGTYSPSSGRSRGTAAESELLQDYIARQDVNFEASRQFAWKQAKHYVQEHLGDDSDPDQLLITTLYIYQQGSEPHPANVAQSMNLTDALMRNWQQDGNGQFFDHLGHLRAYTPGGYPVEVSQTPLPLWDCFAYEAIYRRTTPQRFDRSTHVAIDPKAFKRYVWDADLQTKYLRGLRDYWTAHRDVYDVLIKAALLRSAYVQQTEGSLGFADKTLVLRGLGLDARQSWDDLTLEAFVSAPLSASITFHELVLYRYVATDIIVINDTETGRLVVYVPGNSSPLHGFEGMTALRDWVVRQCKDTRRISVLEGHFKLHDDPDGLFLSGVRTTLAGLAAYPCRLNDATGHWSPHKEITLGPALSVKPFSHMRRNLRDRLRSDAKMVISTKADYKKALAAQALNDAIVVTGIVAMAVPVLWAPLAAMSLALTGLGVDEVVEGKTLAEKEQGEGRIVFGLLNAVPEVVQGLTSVSSALGAAMRPVDEAFPGSADMVGQMVENRTAEERASARARREEDEAQVADETHAREGESADERQTRLQEDEQQRQAFKSHRKTTYDSSIAFGVEPEGLRSLSPEQRTLLAQFEYDGPLPPAGTSGEWTTDSFGAAFICHDNQTGEARYYARVHARLYAVERVEAQGQYRIIESSTTSIVGPYIKRTKGFYSDIDLRSGLRGGTVSITESPSTEYELSGTLENIVQAHGQRTPVIAYIPMDTIEVRSGLNAQHEPVPQYFLMNTPQGTRVTYYADQWCWGKNDRSLFWRNKKGAWKTGDEEAFIAARNARNVRFDVKYEPYALPLLPGLPARPEAVDMTVHQIWLGDRLPAPRLIDTIKHNMRTSPELKFTLHIDIDNNEVREELTPKALLQTEFAEYPTMTISNIRDESFYDSFIFEQQTGNPYIYFRSPESKNLAAAADVLRYRLIHEYGGIYMDCDDVIGASFSGQALEAGPSDILVGAPVSAPRMSFYGPNNSHFASHPGNPVLTVIQEQLYARFEQERAALDALKLTAGQVIDGKLPYMTKIFEVTGPQLFLDVLKKTRPDYADLLDGEIKLKEGVVSFAFVDYRDKVADFYAPFAKRLKISAGRENSWGRGRG